MLVSQFYDSALTEPWDSSHRLFYEPNSYFNSSLPRREKQIWIRNNHSGSVFVRVRPGSKNDGEFLSDELDSWLQFGLSQTEVDEDEITFSLSAGQVRSYWVAVNIPDDSLNVVELGDRFPVYSQYVDVAVRTGGTDADGQILLNSQYDFDNGGNYRGVFYSEDGLRTVDGQGDYWQDFDFRGSTPFRISDAERLGDGITSFSAQLTFRRANTREDLPTAPPVSVPESTPSNLGFVRLNLQIVGARNAVSVESVRFNFEGSIATSYLFGTYLAYQARSDFPEGVVIVDMNEVVKYVVSNELISFNFGYKRDGGNASFSLGLRLDWDAVLPFQYDDFVLYVKDGIVSYRGIIDSIRNRYNVKERIDVSGSGLASQLNSIMVTDRFRSIGIKTILLTLLDKYLSESHRPEIRYRLRDIEDIEDTATFTFRNESLHSVIQKLASFSGANPTNRGGDGTDIIWGVNENGLFYFRRKSTEFKYPFHIGRNVSFDNSRVAPEFNSLLLIGDTGGNDFQNYLFDGDCELTQGSSNPTFFQLWNAGENVPVVATRALDDVQHGSQAYKVEVDHADSFDLSKAFQNKPTVVISGGRYRLSYYAKANQSFTVDLGVTLVFGIVDPETSEFSALNVDVSEGASGSSVFLGGDLASWRWEETIGNLGSGEANLQTTVLSIRYIDLIAVDREAAIRAENLVGQSLTIENQTNDGPTITGRVTSVRYNPLSVSMTLSNVLHTGATDNGDSIKIRLASSSQIFFSLGEGYAKYFIPAFTAPLESHGVPYENLGLVVIFHPKMNSENDYFILDSIFLYLDRANLPEGRYLRQDGHLYEYEYFGSDVEYEVRVTDLTLQAEFGRRKETVETVDSINGFTEAFRYAKTVLGTKGNENRRLRLTVEDSEEFFLPYSIDGDFGEINWGYAQIFGSQAVDSFYEYVIVSVSHTLKNNRLSSKLELGSPFPSPSKIVRDLTARERFRGELGSREGARSNNPLAGGGGGGGGGAAAAATFMLPTGQELYDLITPFLDYDDLMNNPFVLRVQHSYDGSIWVDAGSLLEFEKTYVSMVTFETDVLSNQTNVSIPFRSIILGYVPSMADFALNLAEGHVRVEQGNTYFEGDIIRNDEFDDDSQEYFVSNLQSSGVFTEGAPARVIFTLPFNFLRVSPDDGVTWFNIADFDAIQTDWEETDEESSAFILNKPLVEPQVQTDWDETDADSPAFLLSKPDIPDIVDLPDLSDFLTRMEILGLSPQIVSSQRVYDRMKEIVRTQGESFVDFDNAAVTATWGAYVVPQVQTDWDEADEESLAFLVSKPVIEPQVQTDWEETDEDSSAFLLGKPDIPDIVDLPDLSEFLTSIQVLGLSPQIVSGQRVYDRMKEIVRTQGESFVDFDNAAVTATWGAYVVPQVRADWEEMDTDSLGFLLNKPTIEPQVQTNWDDMDAESLAFLLNKPTIEPQVQTDWDETDEDSLAFLLSKPELPDFSEFLTAIQILQFSSSIVSRGRVYRRMKQIIESEPESLIEENDEDQTITWSIDSESLGDQVQADWDETDEESLAFLLNKPVIEPQIQTDWDNMDAESLAFLLNKPTIEPQSQTDWDETDADSLAFLLNKPDIPDIPDIPDFSEFLTVIQVLELSSSIVTRGRVYQRMKQIIESEPESLIEENDEDQTITWSIDSESLGDQVQTDWDETDADSLAFLLNKPEIPDISDIPDVSDFLTRLDVLGLSSQIVTRGNVYDRMKEIVESQPESLIEEDDDDQSITWSIESQSLSDQVQTDWDETDADSLAFLLNKPDIPDIIDIPDLSEFLTRLDVLGLSSQIVTRGNVYRRMKEIVRYQPDALVDTDDSGEIITWSTGPYIL